MGFLSKLFKVKRRSEEEEGGEEYTATSLLASSRYPRKPTVVLIGSDKGGSGKSLIAGNLTYVVAANVAGGEGGRVILVDTDFRNTQHITSRVLRSSLGKVPSDTEYVNFVEVIMNGVRGKLSVLERRPKVTTCTGRVMTAPFLFIPSVPNILSSYYDFLYSGGRENRYLMALAERYGETIKSTLPQSVIQHIVHLLTKLRAVNPHLVVIDAPPATSLSNWEGVYMRLLEEADVFLYVAIPYPNPPPYDSFKSVYMNYLDKTVIVLNRVKFDDLKKNYALRSFIEFAGKDGIPVFLVPESEADSEVFDKEGYVPARRLDSTTAIPVGALARYLQLIPSCRYTGCCRLYDEYLQLVLSYQRLLLGGGRL